MTTQVQLTGGDPYILPTAVRLSELGLPAGQLPVQLHFQLKTGQQLHLPIEAEALHALARKLAGLFPDPSQ